MKIDGSIKDFLLSNTISFQEIDVYDKQSKQNLLNEIVNFPIIDTINGRKKLDGVKTKLNNNQREKIEKIFSCCP
jgi:hypothetical protein